MVSRTNRDCGMSDDTSTKGFTRRQYLSTISIGIVTSIAGCSGGGNGSNGSTGNGENSSESNNGTNQSSNGRTSGNNTTNSSNENDESSDSESPLELLSHEWYEEEYEAGVEGVVQNTSDEQLSYAEVSIIFLNEEDQQVNSNYTNTTDLAAGREWSFDVLFLGDDASNVADYEISTSTSPM